MQTQSWNPYRRDHATRALVAVWISVLVLALLLTACSSTQRAGERFIPAAMGTAAGAGAGLLVGGPVGAVVGAGTGAVVTSIATPDCAELYASGSTARGIEEIRGAPGYPVTRYETPSRPRPWKGLLGGAAALALAYWQRRRLVPALKALWGKVPKIRRRG